MKTKNFLAFLTLVTLAQNSAWAVYNGPTNIDNTSIAKKQSLFSKYCTGQFNGLEIPAPNYRNADVLAAVKQMSTVASSGYYFYPQVLKIYKLGTKDKWIQPPADAPKNITSGSHAFLVQLCAEFRDRPTMIAEKINWLKNLYKPQFKEQQPIDPRKNIWAQMTAKSYDPFIRFTGAIWRAKQTDMGRNGKLKLQLGQYEVDAPVEPLTICETKHILTNYISNPDYTNDEGRQKLSAFVSSLYQPDAFSEYSKAPNLT